MDTNGHESASKHVLAGLALTFILATGCDSGSGSIRGRVVLQGDPPPEVAVKLDAITAKLRPEGMRTRFYDVSPDGGLPNVLVQIIHSPAPLPRVPARETAVMEITRGRAEPHMIAIQTNQAMAYRNLDPIAHNAHITVRPGSGNREVNYAMLPRVKPKVNSPRAFWDWLCGKHKQSGARLESLRFPSPELHIRIKCDVHPWEFAYVCVLDHGYFAMTDADGMFALPPGLPPGQYVLEARHRRLGILTNAVTLRSGKTTTINFTFP